MFRIFDVNDSGLVLEWHEFFIPLLTYYLLSSPYLQTNYNFLKLLRSKSLSSVSDKWLTKQLREIWLEIGFHHSLRNVNGLERRFVAKKRSDLNDKEWIYYARFIKAMGFNVKIYRMWSPKKPKDFARQKLS